MKIPPHIRRHAREYGVLVVLAAAIVPLVVVLASRSSDGDGGDKAALPGAGGTQAVELTQKDDGAGGVTVEVTWVTAVDLESDDFERARGRDLSKELLFLVTMDTHSGDLAQYDLKAVSVLRDSEGREFVPQAWEGWEEGGHHRQGLLVFQRPPTTGGVQLTILGVAGTPQRVFRWDAVPTS